MTSLRVRQRRKHEKRDLLRWLYDGECFWCGNAAGGDLTLDELLPVSRGGLRTIANQVPAHRHCNQNRGNMIPPAAAFIRHRGVLKAAGIAI